MKNDEMLDRNVAEQVVRRKRALGNKVIPSNYPTIQHLPNSKMRDDDDSCLNEREVEYLTKKTRLKDDVVIVTEKVDGCNVGVLRDGDSLIPLMRRGYEVSTSPHEFIRMFADFVRQNEYRFMSLLSDGERVCGEWMIKTHTIQYHMKHEPFICFEIIRDKERVRYLDARKRLLDNGFVCAGLVHYGTAIPVNTAVEMLGDGFHGAVGQPEGVVYRYENAKQGWLFNAKFVSNPLVGDAELFRKNIDSGLMNKWR